MLLPRRTFLAGAAGVLAAPRMLFAQAATDRRFVFIIQRGAADGLHTVVPYADPAYAALRGALAIDPASATKLDGSFALHPSLQEFGRLYTQGQALFVHAVASPYRDRSHFDGQNVLESGGTAPYQLKDGWMNRLVRLLPQRGKEAIAFAPTVPLALRGAAEVSSYAPSALPAANEDLLLRVQQLYEGDAQLHALWSAAMDAQNMAGAAGQGGKRQDPAELGRVAANFLAQPQGPRIAMIETGGWDTHSAQAPRLAAQLRNLDALVAALREGLGAAWQQTVVLVATEFGRTAAANGTGGTDHGTASAALLAGGAVQGGRVIADWPGLAASALYEGRDLRPTQDLDALIAATAADAFALDRDRVARALFPEMRAGRALPRLVRA
ncbi:DUF1501 domain-containing protein [Ramlibacter ginsenosidimutans]|uniref:DUF1501 domain-containing protein n=1 Tax=Ramlibacter ginsenosidimutans TaxID=502333 RepID=A0A934TUL1_9BURK|nr:DUF1501 domain-containing protein [Ramlibacter ginsenosidimutans]MBK6007887.1 DUF1501 domain-containing protein [Ramlibacter ginsenosidimutans]